MIKSKSHLKIPKYMLNLLQSSTTRIQDEGWDILNVLIPNSQWFSLLNKLCKGSTIMSSLQPGWRHKMNPNNA